MRRNIAIIDDEFDIGYLLKNNIGADSFDVYCFQDLEKGLQALPALNPMFLFLDISFPGGNGLDHIRHIKTILPECIIIVISALDDLVQTKNAYQAGANDFISKPFTRAVILERIRLLSLPNQSLS